MKVLLIGGGGREHAIAAALHKSPLVDHIWCAPGNGGTDAFCENLPLKATDVPGVVAFCMRNHPDLVAVIPDDPLCLGMVDALGEIGVTAFGPTKNAAVIEGSKAFAKEFMARHRIPTAACQVFDSLDAARQYVDSCPLPTVIKADGLALGKGVIICETRREAQNALTAMMEESLFGEAGSRVIVEEFLQGPEVSVLCFTDGETLYPMPAAQDHKRALDGDKGPNTGGMGAFSPVSVYDEAMQARCLKEIFLPTIRGLKEEGRRFKGVLYFSLMLTESGPKVIEYNARFGDPETQAVLPLLKSDLCELFLAICQDRLHELKPEWSSQASCCVVMASGGYPGSYQKGMVITGIDEAEKTGACVYHAGTAISDRGLITSGGRVLGVCAQRSDLRGAIAAAYAAVDRIRFDGAFYRRDIGKKDKNA